MSTTVLFLHLQNDPVKPVHASNWFKTVFTVPFGYVIGRVMLMLRMLVCLCAYMCVQVCHTALK